MSKRYQELVGLQVTFDKVVARYSMTHYYRREQIITPRPAMVMRGYDVERTKDMDVIAEDILQAYEPAVLTIWVCDAILSASQYLQFQPAARPDELEIEGDWKILP